jgi:outer membrane protein OmpA-like peptidoglycan-associated protein
MHRSMNPLHLTTCVLVAAFSVTTSFAQASQTPAGSSPTIVLATDPSWDVSGKPTQFGEYPLPAELMASATSPLWGGTYKAVIAATNDHSKIIPGSQPIWRNRRADKENEAYQFRKAVSLGANPIRKATLEINCDDVGRVYINKRLVSVDKRDGRLKDGWDRFFDFRSVTGFMYDRIYTYDVTDYFFTNATNWVLIEGNSLAFDGSHAYVSAKVVIEFDPLPAPPSAATAAKPKPASAKATGGLPASAKATADKANTVFEAGRDPEIEKLRVGTILELGHVYFKADEYQLDTASYRTLAALAAFMQRHPALKIEVGGHTNLRPNDRFAAELSTNRARAVMRYLTDNGVAAARVTYKGYGKSQPRVKALSKEADRANQRVEIKVLEK